MAAIHFFSEDITFNVPQKVRLRNWIRKTIQAEKFILKELNFIFCSDEYLLVLNRQYLSHNTYTDIITFDNSDTEMSIEGDVFISIERVKENAAKFQVDFLDELHRVMIHGTLHLLGYPDKGVEAKQMMTSKEDQYLNLRNLFKLP